MRKARIWRAFLIKERKFSENKNAWLETEGSNSLIPARTWSPALRRRNLGISLQSTGLSGVPLRSRVRTSLILTRTSAIHGVHDHRVLLSRNVGRNADCVGPFATQPFAAAVR